MSEILENITEQSFKNACLGSIGVDSLISESYYKGIILQGIIGE